MEQLYNNDTIDALSVVKSIFHHLNKTNINNMVKKIIVLPIKTVELLEEIADFIHTKALMKYNYTVLYAQLCSCMIKDSKFNKLGNSKITFQKLLVQKCYDVFFSYEIYQQDLKKLKMEIKHKKKNLSYFKITLCHFQFDYNNRMLYNIKFMCELFKLEVLPIKIILICITELSKKKDDLHMYYLCVTLKLVGQKLSKTHNLDDIIKLILLFKYENSEDISSTLKTLIIELNNLHSNDWKSKELLPLDEESYVRFIDLPMKLKKVYELKSYYIIAESIFEDCHDVLFKFAIKKEANDAIHLLTKTWIQNNHLTFVTSLILVAINEDQNIRYDAGTLLDYLVMERFLSKYSVKSGVSKVFNNNSIQNDFSNLSNLLFDIISEFKF